MLFNSIEFLFFLPIVFVLYWFVFKKQRIQNLFIVFASYLFYGWWDWHFLLLIAFTSLCSYLSGIAIQYDRAHGGRYAKCYATLNILINLFVLGIYKYYDFFVQSFVDAFQSMGVQLQATSLNLVLPVGISFYTFQALSYTIDVYKKKIEPTRDIIAFFAFISFFPQLVAGPIERATNLLPQFLKPRRFDYAKAVDGCRQILWGFFKKMVVADNCASAVNIIWDNYPHESGFTLLLGGLFFTFQIYGDFSGYSDIAIGTARLFGMNLMRNFNFPYFSRDIAEFWRRWHISLTTWFRDYIYFPLGGSRCERWKVMRNTLIIFLVSGFWHGANWTFIAWGAYHAFLFFPLLWFGMNRKYLNAVAEDKLLPSLTEVIQMSTTFFLALIGWIIFRAETIGQAWDYLGSMFSPTLFNLEFLYGKKALLFIAVLMIVEWLQRDKQHALQLTHSGIFRNRLCRWLLYYTLIIAILFLFGSQKTFIYFQF